VAAGILVTAVAALLPAALLRRLPTAHLLAEE
jgi:putative ABC transport system permease protein